MVTSNHIHLLVKDTGANVIAQSMRRWCGVRSWILTFHSPREGPCGCQIFNYLIPAMESVIEVVANLLRIHRDTFIPGRIDRCPECNSDKLVFPKSRSKKKENESRGNQVALSRLRLRRLPERLRCPRFEFRVPSFEFFPVPQLKIRERQRN
jgi:hypothetical protein